MRVIALAGPGGATDPRSRGCSALDYVGTDQLDPAHANRARVEGWSSTKVERKLRRRDSSTSSSSSDRFGTPPARPIDSASLTRSPVNEAARDASRAPRERRVSLPPSGPLAGTQKSSVASVAALLAIANEEIERLRNRVAGSDKAVADAKKSCAQEWSASLSATEKELSTAKAHIESQVSERVNGLLQRAAAAAARRTDALRREVEELQAEVARLRPYETRLHMFMPIDRELDTWTAATGDAEAGPHKYRYNRCENRSGVWRFKDKQT